MTPYDSHVWDDDKAFNFQSLSPAQKNLASNMY